MVVVFLYTTDLPLLHYIELYYSVLNDTILHHIVPYNTTIDSSILSLISS